MFLAFTILMLFVITLLTLVSMLPNTVAEEMERIELTKERLAVIEQAVHRYRDVSSTQRMPCPARLNVSRTHNKFGKEVNPCFQCGSGFVKGSSDGIKCASSANVIIGAVPTRTLSLSDEYAFDGWGNKFSYAVDIDMAISISAISSGTNDLYIEGVGGVNATNEEGDELIDYIRQSIAAIIISHGKDGRGASNAIGTEKSCNTAHEDGENCNTNEIFVVDRWNKLSNSYYDDIVHPIIYTNCSEPAGVINQPPISYAGSTVEPGDSHHTAVRNLYCNAPLSGSSVIECKNGVWIGSVPSCS